ncbi:hypothetical protein [Pseudomonas syringae]|uniref:Uncharacterized protein n=1 Tax=Pseudomonas syringae pv. actinidiae TaxID=103796 RepID=A0A2P0QFM9_PSESF|nr:hypothetical protein [Pseudomonas syringae]APQ06931.1 hypothetical protein PsaNZ47_29755 [Pseudomonas syringae pv. actinidiae]ARO44990.1 hypothetical protein [Pseudomonas syringae pv. actinidiae]ARO45095.1 hypothetical protein [Pseudomonas syringae pv. actinidiae]ARO45186.1 hypothetical protein [Pseudomonas syringae pv. actinidiae]MDU8387943.1 hypothetical protein [Pseudomonas syringae pv. actinidiae]
MPKTLPIRLTDEQTRRLEEGAALAGYKHVSTYARDRLFSLIEQDKSQDQVAHWATMQKIEYQLDSIEQSQAVQQTLMAATLYLISENSSTGVRNGLRAQLKSLGASTQILDALLPDLASDIERISGDE